MRNLTFALMALAATLAIATFGAHPF